MRPFPRIALVGRPNVGKSTLFNRVSGQRKAITDSRPGSTRDRNYQIASWQGAAFELVDTGGLLLGSDDPLLGPAAEHARRAIAEADCVVLVVDGRAGLLPDDEAIVASLRRQGKTMVLAVNKAESEEAAPVEEFARLGIASVVPISAEHGLGVGDLLDAALSGLPRVAPPEAGEEPLRVALVGRPNVGKSSLLNRLLGEDRALVSPIPGTTRDAVDSLLVRGERRYLLVDTAGIRRVRLLKENVDHVAVVQARRSISRADVALLVLDAAEGLREMDATIAGYVHEAGRGIVVVANKWDLVGRERSRKAFTQDIRDNLKFLPYAPIVFTSAVTGAGEGAIFAALERVGRARATRVTTGELNRVIGRAAAAHTPRAAKGDQPIKILYAAQIGTEPPTFALSVNHPVDLHFSYRRYLENQLRASFGFEGTPLVLKVRARRRS